MGWGINDVVNGVRSGAQGVATGVQQATRGGGINQWGQNLATGGSTAANGFMNMTSGGLWDQATGNGGKGGAPGAPVDPYSGMPAIPDFQNPYDPKTMSMLPGYMAEQKANSSGLNAMRSLALSGGESPWSRAAKGENDAQLSAELDRGAAGVAGQRASNDAAMAMQGGLSEGARERNSMSANKNYVGMAQTANQTHDLNNLNIAKTDESNKLGMLSGVTSAEQNQVQGYQQARGADVGNEIANNRAANDYNMQKYGIQSATWGAGKTADAQAASGKKSPI